MTEKDKINYKQELKKENKETLRIKHFKTITEQHVAFLDKNLT